MSTKSKSAGGRKMPKNQPLTKYELKYIFISWMLQDDPSWSGVSLLTCSKRSESTAVSPEGVSHHVEEGKTTDSQIQTMFKTFVVQSKNPLSRFHTSAVTTSDRVGTLKARTQRINTKDSLSLFVSNDAAPQQTLAASPALAAESPRC